MMMSAMVMSVMMVFISLSRSELAALLRVSNFRLIGKVGWPSRQCHCRTVTGVPILLASKNCLAFQCDRRTQPWEAG